MIGQQAPYQSRTIDMRKHGHIQASEVNEAIKIIHDILYFVLVLDHFRQDVSIKEFQTRC
jgi:hypothetical protein